MAVRSVPVKGPLIKMMAEHFPDFKFSSDWRGTYCFIRERPGYWYDYLRLTVTLMTARETCPSTGI